MKIPHTALAVATLAVLTACGSSSTASSPSMASSAATTSSNSPSQSTSSSSSPTATPLYPEEWYGELGSGPVKGSDFRQYVLKANEGAYDVTFDKQHYNEVHSFAGVVHASARDASGHRTYTAQLQFDGYSGLDGPIHQLRWSDTAPTVMERSGNTWVRADRRFDDVYPGDPLRPLWENTPDGTYNADTRSITVGKWVVTVPDDSLRITRVRLVGSADNQPEVRSQPTH